MFEHDVLQSAQDEETHSSQMCRIELDAANEAGEERTGLRALTYCHDDTYAAEQRGLRYISLLGTNDVFVRVFEHMVRVELQE